MVAEQDPQTIAPPQAPKPDVPPRERMFLVVVDKTEEMRNALRFACRRAQHTDGRVGLLYYIEPADFQHWMGVEAKMREEKRDEAEQILQALASEVQSMSGKIPVLYVREGSARDTILAVIEEEPRIAVLVLGAGTSKRGPGPLVAQLAGKISGRFPVPITVVPGHLTEEQIDLLS
jgi:nucleotide-binding universal stress UspA family protein